MDVNKNLTEQLILAKEIQAWIEESKGLADLRAILEVEDKISQKAARLAEVVRALDAWLCERGSLPERWGFRGRCPSCGASCGCL